MEATTTDTALAAFDAAGKNEEPSLPQWAVAMSDTELVDARADVVAVIDLHEEKLRPARERKALIESVLLKRLIDRGATVLAHPDFDVTVECKSSTDVLVSELMPLFTMATEGQILTEDLAKALWWETPAPVLRKHLTYLKGLAKKYGAPVQAILDKAVRTIAGVPKLSIEPKERPQKHVTGDAA